MTSIVDKYYRRIAQNIDNVTMKFDISGLLVKTKEHDSKIDTNKENISENLSLIETNKSNIAENLSLIEINKDNISENLSLIETNKDNISENLKLINELIEILKNKIPEKIFKKKYNIVSKKFNFNRT